MNELQKIIAEIKYRTGDTVDQIAGVIGYTRPHLTSAIGKGHSTHVKDALLKHYGKKLKDYWDEEESVLHEDQPDIKAGNVAEKNVAASAVVGMVMTNGAMLRVMLRAVAEMLARQRNVKVSIVLSELTKAIEDEALKEFDGL